MVVSIGWWGSVCVARSDACLGYGIKGNLATTLPVCRITFASSSWDAAPVLVS